MQQYLLKFINLMIGNYKIVPSPIMLREIYVPSKHILDPAKKKKMQKKITKRFWGKLIQEKKKKKLKIKLFSFMVGFL